MNNEKNTPIFVSLAETALDCEDVAGWARRNDVKNLKIIALSLESFQYLRKQKNIDYDYVWKMIAMEEIFHNAFLKSQKAVEEWKSIFADREDYFYDEAFGYELDFYLSYHSLVCIDVAERLKDIFLKENWIYLAIPARLVFISAYFPNPSKVLFNNFLFKSLSVDIFKHAGIQVRHISPFDHLKISAAGWVFLYHVIYKLIWDAAETVWSFFIRAPHINTALGKTDRRVDVVISGWGSNISQMLSWKKMREEFKKNGNLSRLNLVWRPEKIAGFERNEMSGDDDKFIIVRENVKNGVAYGPKLSMFPLYFWPRYFYSLFGRIILPRFYQIFWKRGNGNSALKELFNHRSIRLNMAFNVFFAYRSVFLTNELLKKVFAKTAPRFFIGSDSGAANSRGEILFAKKRKIITLSTPHGYQAYSMPAYNYLADYVLTHSPATGEAIIASGVVPEKVIVVGTNHRKEDKPKGMPIKKANIVIATRSRGGLWSNYSSRHDDYDREMSGLLRMLAREDKFETIIKSHPNGDYHTYYDLLVKEINSPLISHIPEGWKLDEFYRRCDVLVCIGEMPSFLIAAIYFQIPIVFIEGTMTKTLKSLHYDYRGCAVVIGSFEEAGGEIERLISDSDYREAALSKQNEFAKKFIKDNPERNLVDLLGKLM